MSLLCVIVMLKKFDLFEFERRGRTIERKGEVSGCDLEKLGLGMSFLCCV